MIRRSALITVAACAALLASPPLLAADQAPAPGQPAPRDPETRADLSFAGGTVAQYIEAVGRAFGAANAAVAPDAAGMKVASVQLKSVTRADAVKLLDALTGGQAGVSQRGETFGIFNSIPTNTQHKFERVIKVWPLERILSRMKAEEALTAVQSAIDMTGDSATVNFHPDTSLLIVHGTGPQVGAVDQVVDRLDEVADMRAAKAAADAAAPPNAPDELAALRTRIDELQRDISGLNQAVKFLMSRNQDPADAGRTSSPKP